ncbi:hypothetical protein V1524DRAFT_414380 [Lipomyces starkeyi]
MALFCDCFCVGGSTTATPQRGFEHISPPPALVSTLGCSPGKCCFVSDRPWLHDVELRHDVYCALPRPAIPLITTSCTGPLGACLDDTAPPAASRPTCDTRFGGSHCVHYISPTWLLVNLKTERLHIRHPAPVAAATQPQGTSSSLSSLLDGWKDLDNPTFPPTREDLPGLQSARWLYVTTNPPLGWLAMNLGMWSPCKRRASQHRALRPGLSGSVGSPGLSVADWGGFCARFLPGYPCDPMAAGTIRLLC